MSLDELLTDVGAELDRLSSLHDGPLEHSQVAERRPVVIAAVVVMLVATGAGVYAVVQRDTVQSPVAPHVSSVLQAVPPSVALTVVPQPTPTSIGVEHSALTQVVIPGSTGPDVDRLQQRLSDLGFALGPIDGVYGAATEQAVWAFKKLVGGMSYQELVDDRQAGAVTDDWWAQMSEPVTIEPRRPGGVGTHVEVYLPSQVLVVFVDDRPALIAHISSGELDDLGRPAQWCETVTFDTDDAGQPLPQPITRSDCLASKTPGGVFKVTRVFDGKELTELGGMYNPVFFNYGIAIHGADNVPNEPASHGAIRINRNVADALLRLVHIGDTVYVWGHDGKDPEIYTRQESLPSFASPDPTTTSP